MHIIHGQCHIELGIALQGRACITRNGRRRKMGLQQHHEFSCHPAPSYIDNVQSISDEQQKLSMKYNGKGSIQFNCIHGLDHAIRCWLCYCSIAGTGSHTTHLSMDV